MQPTNLIELLEIRAREFGSAPKYASLDGALAVTRSLSFAALDRSARAIGARLQELCAAGDRVLIACGDSLDFLEAFFGALYAGAMPAPVCPPRPRRPLARLGPVAHDSGASIAIVSAAAWRWTANAVANEATLSRMQWLLFEDLPRDGSARPRATSDIAFIQYTSGSTAEPRGVAVGHDNVLSNCACIQDGFRHTPETVAVTWLPHYHDMGLIAGLLQPLYIGHACYCLEPMQFLQQPARWLRAISQFRAGHSGAPPFGYRLCCEKARPAETAGLDLSCWRTAYIGAEPIHKETLDRFAATFAPAGFRASAFYPAYGLAEATLKVTGGEPGDGPVYTRSPDGRVLTGCGRAASGVELRIVDPENGAPCAEGVVGEVWVRGPGVARGYWSEKAPAPFHGTGEYLRTGDLGLLRDGVLFIAGRLKDVIIVNGRDVHPQDIERAAVECANNSRTAGAAAFSLEEAGEERIVLLYEVGVSPVLDANALARRIRAAVVRENEVDVSRIVFVKRGAIPRTTSGKPQRFLCRSRYLAGELPGFAIPARGALA